MASIKKHLESTSTKNLMTKKIFLQIKTDFFEILSNQMQIATHYCPPFLLPTFVWNFPQIITCGFRFC